MEQPKEDKGVRLIVTGGICIVSKQDVKLACSMYLYKDKDGYIRCQQGRYKYLHNLLMQHRDPEYPVDHINECTWDNRRSNLRILTRAENTVRPRRLDEEEARLLEAYQNGELLASELHEWLRKRRDSGKL